MTTGNSGERRRGLSSWMPWVGIAVFLIALFAYVERRTPHGAQALTASVRGEGAAPSGEVEHWYAVAYKDQRIGWTHAVSGPAADGDGEVRQDEMHLRMTLMDEPRDVTTRTVLELDNAGFVRTFAFRMDSGGVNIRVEGAQHPGRVDVTIYSAGTTQPLSFAVEEPIVMPGNLATTIAGAGLEVGKKYTRSFFDPSVMKPAKMRIEILEKEKLKVGARAIDVFKVRQTYSGLETTSWIDASGVAYKEESPTGFSSFRTTEVDAKRLGDGPKLDLIAATSIAAENPVPNPRLVRKLVIELGGIDFDGFDLDGDGQRLEGNRLVIDRNDLPAASIEPAAYLRAEPLMQVDDPAVHKALREATGGLQTADEVSKRVLKWVYGSLSKSSTVSLPSALEVLRTREGDCNEHAVLYTTMVRAGGVPARIASGLVALGDRFYYHAWTEIHLDGRWVAVDPVFGQYPADATHIRFVTGGLERQAELMRVIGKLRLKVLNYST